MSEQLLFTYGTLQLPEIQQKIFGRLLQGKADAMTGYRIEPIMLQDHEAARALGEKEFKILVPSGKASDTIQGQVYALSQTELIKADDYEAEAYKRIEVPLQSGKRAWVYVKA